MCGRFSLSKRELVEITSFLDAVVDESEATLYKPRYNVAPSDTCFIVRPDADRKKLVRASWGFPTETAPGVEKLVINARAETVGERHLFRDALARRRCVVPADGFFEWTGGKGRRRPIWFHAPGGQLLLFAGLWEPRSDGGVAFTIVTTDANVLVAPVHDRMPVVLSRADADAWLAAPRVELLRPAPESALEGTAVSSRVNAVENDDPSCLEPSTEPPEPQLKLF
jgi:putative SOS response-associated peptidase YedK